MAPAPLLQAMQALVQSTPRAELELRTVPVPRPGAGDVLVKVAASTVHPLDFKILRYGIISQDWPVTGGNEFAGTVVALGLGVEKLQVNDRIITSTIGWIEGFEVAGWQQYALVHADLCTKIPDSVSFPLAATVPTSFITASIALALDLGLKYPDPPPPPPRKTAAGVWAAALASLKGGAEFEFDLEDGVVEGGSWYPSEAAMRKYSGCLGINGGAAPSHLPMVPSSTPSMSEPERRRILDAGRYKVNDRTFRLSADDNGLEPIASSPYVHPTQDQDSYAPLHSAGLYRPPQPPAIPVPRYSASTRALQPIELGDLWDNVHPMSWGTGDLSREAMDRRLGSGWDEPNRPPRLVEVIEVASGSSSGASSGMGRSGSDESCTSIEEVAPLPHPGLPSGKGKESGRRRGSGSGPGALTGVGAGGLVLRGTASGKARGSTSPFRVPAAVSTRRHGSPPYIYRGREMSPGPRPSTSGSGSGSTRPGSSGASSTSTRPTSAGAHAYGRLPTRPMSALEELIYHGRAATPALPVAYAFDEPILVWGGGTSVGRNALQLLKRAGYTNVLVVASTERHIELAEISPAGTKFFDYRDPKVVPQIQIALGVWDLKKVLECVSLPHTLKLVAQVVSPGAVVAALLPVQTPMPDGVELKMTKFARCHDFDGKDVASATFGREKMWPLLGEMLRAGEYVFPEIVHLRGGMQACATNAVGMMSRGENAGKRLVFSVPDS